MTNYVGDIRRVRSSVPTANDLIGFLNAENDYEFVNSTWGDAFQAGYVIPSGATTALPIAQLFANRIPVEAFGAAGDGLTNDTAAFQAAINACKGTSSVVLLGRKKYLVDYLTGVEEIAIMSEAPIEAETPYNDDGAVIMQTNTSNSLISYGNKVWLSGISFFWPNQTNANYSGGAPVTYQTALKPTAATKTQWFRMDRCTFVNAYDAIQIGQASYPTGDVRLVGNRICAMRRGITLNNAPDVIFMDGNMLSIAPYGDEINGATTSLRDWIAANGVGIYVAGSDSIDGLLMTPSNLIFGMNKAVHVAGGRLNLCQLDGNFDGVEYGVYVDGSAYIARSVIASKFYCYRNGDSSASAATAIRMGGTATLGSLTVSDAARFEYAQGSHIVIDGTIADKIQINAKYFGAVGAGSGASGDKYAIAINDTGATADVHIGAAQYVNETSYANAIGVQITSARHVTIADGFDMYGFKTPVKLSSTATHYVGSGSTRNTSGSNSIENSSSGTGILRQGHYDKSISGNDGLSKVLARYTSGGLVTSGTTPLTVVFNTEVHDTNGDYNTSTGVFTAPRTGRYAISVVMNGTGDTNGDLFAVKVVTGNRTYGSTYTISKQTFIESLATISVLADMDSADTASVTITRISGTGTFTPAQSDAEYYPTLSIEFVG